MYKKRLNKLAISKPHLGIALILLIVVVLYIVIAPKLFASTNYIWDFSTAGDYSLSDSNKIQVTGGVTSLKQVQTNITTNNQTTFDQGTYYNTQFSASNLTINGVPQTTPVTTSGLVSLWAMENNWNDSKGSNNGTAFGNAGFITSGSQKVGTYSGNFDGTGDYVTVADNPSIALGTGSFSVSMWAKITTTTAAYRGLVSKRTNANYTGWSIYTGPNSTVLTSQVAAVHTGPYYSANGVDLGLNTWAHMTFVFDRTANLISVYKNGYLASAPASISGLGSSSIYNSTPLRIAGEIGQSEWPGQIDELAIFNKALSSAEVRDNYLKVAGKYGEYTSQVFNTSVTNGATWQNISWNPLQTYAKELPNSHGVESGYNDSLNMTDNIGLWHFNNSLSDSVNSNNGTFVGNTTYNTDSLLGSHSLIFDGNGDYVNFTKYNELEGSNSYAVSVWLKTLSSSTQAVVVQADASSNHIAGSIRLQSGIPSFVTYEGSYSNVAAVTRVDDGRWHYITVTKTASIGRIYVDATLEGAGPVKDVNVGSTTVFRLGAEGSLTYYVNGQIDEVSVWNRPLTQSEVTIMYQRAINKLKFQVRSCDDNACSGESFIGPDGTSNSYYSESNNSNLTPPNINFTNLANNQYFQYKMFLETENTANSPKVQSNSIGYQNYPIDNPYTYSTSSLNLTHIPQTINHFCEGTLDGSGNCTPTVTKPSGTQINYQICNDIVANCILNSTWKYWNGANWVNAVSAVQNNTASVINSNISSFPVSTQYFAFKAFLQSGGQNSPTLSDLSIDANFDTTRPTTNAYGLSMTSYSSGAWANIKPTVNWNLGSDDTNGVGLLGYCVSLDEANIGSSHNVNPETSGGILGSIDDGISQNYCPYIVSGNSINLSVISGLSLTTGKQYYFSIKAVDIAGNVWSGASNLYQDLVSFKFDNTAPTNPAFISMPSNFISTKDVTITWPTLAPDAANDVGVGLAGLQYKIGASGIWYGDLHNGNQNLTDLLVNDGTYTTNPSIDYPNLSDGNNVIYFRTLDLAGNTSTSNVTGVLKINTTAPSSPENLSVTPTNNTTNSYAFDWDPPATFIGSAANLVYCYTINTLPALNTCTYTNAGTTSLSADAFATQPDDNTFYVVAKDEADNINYSTAETIVFTYSGDAPGIPLSPDVADISNKDNSEWKLALTWSVPTNTGAGIDNYEIYRSTVANASCTVNPLNFSKVSTVLGTSYIDTGLSQQDYYYCVKACDSANKCSAVSSTVTKYPTGKYTNPASLISGPDLNAKTTIKAVISWVTDRRSDSKIQYGLASGQYFEEEFAVSAQVTAHTITLNNLKAGITYYYKANWTDEDGNTGSSDEKSFTTDPPPVITNVKTKNIGIDSALISFTSNNASGVKIYYGKTTSFEGLQELDTAFTESSYTAILTGLDDGFKYYFKINPLDIEGTEYEGTVLDFTTLPRPIVKNIQIQEVKNVAQPTIEVFWDSNTEISSVVSFNPADTPDLVKNVVDIEPTTTHKMEITNLLANTKYSLIVRGTDAIGNGAESEVHTFTTATDTRPPQIKNVKIEPVTSDSASNTAQIIVSWDTDELATSQVEYSEGSSGEYSQSSQIDKTLAYKHVVVISNLKTANVYHLRAISEDFSKNSSLTDNIVTITTEQQNNALDLVIKGLRDIFNFL